jgi:hypothetical protein
MASELRNEADPSAAMSSKDDEPFESGERAARCVGCGIVPPPTETNYTLISPQHGWRLLRTFDKNGRKVMQWRCPSCWANYRQKAANARIKLR